MTTPTDGFNDPLNGSTPPHILELALSGELARLAGAEGVVTPVQTDQEDAQAAQNDEQSDSGTPDTFAQPPADQPAPTGTPAKAAAKSS